MTSTSTPRDGELDNTLALGRYGYEFILKRCRRYGSDVFETRLMFQRHICMSGAEAARVFYDEARFIRHGAAPRRVKATLLGFGGVQDMPSAPGPGCRSLRRRWSGGRATWPGSSRARPRWGRCTGAAGSRGSGRRRGSPG